MATETDQIEDIESLSGISAGARVVARSSLLRGPFILFVGVVLLEGTTDVQLVALAIRRMHMGTGGPGVLMTAWGVGGMLGGAVLLWLLRKRGYGLALGVGGVAFAACMVLAPLGGSVLAVSAMIPLGLGFALIQAGVMAIIPRLADDAVVGRVYGLMEMLYSGGTAAGALIAPVLIRLVGIGGSMVVVGCGFGCVTLLLLPVLGRLDVHQERASRVRDLLRAIPFFSPLPLPRLERLVEEAQPLHVPAGVAMIRVGEHGDAYYALERGEVEVVEFQRRQGPGTGVGEIALLRDVPRTATVRAVTDVDALRISRSMFLAAVTSHGGAKREADAIVDGYLSPVAAELG